MGAPAGLYDVAVIGAGINGAGIARDAALRGLDVVVLEQGDLCSGTTAWPSRLIHGGLRYLEYGEIPLVFESLRERITLRRIAPHLIQPLRICIPIYDSAKRGPLLIRLGMLAYDLLSVGKTVPNHDMLSRQKIIDAEPGLEREGLRGAARYFDAKVEFIERLVLENLLAARSAGAEVRTYSRVTGMQPASSSGYTLKVQDALSGESDEVSARVVINAGGPWVDSVLGTSGIESPRLIGGTKGSHIVVGAFAGAPRDAYYVEAARDQRPFFIIPWNGQYLIGTTDIRYDGDPGAVRASPEEVEYLLSETNRVFPAAGLTVADVHYAYAGVRPLPYRDQGPESAITRKHIIRVNREIGPGVLSIIGGKLTTYRSLAQQAVDRAARIMRRKLPECRTQSMLLPGAGRLDDAEQALHEVSELSSDGMARLLALYGGRALDVLSLAAEEAPLQKTIDPARTVLAAEVVFAIREEFARSLEDIVYRRLMVGLDAEQGRPLYEVIAAIAGGELGWSESTRHAQLDALRAYSDSFGV